MLREKKHLYLEALRILACYLVIFNHTGGVGFSLFTQCQPGSPKFFLYLGCAVFCKVAVFVFFAISGALLLSRNETLCQVGKRIIKILSGLVLFSFFYYLYEVYLGNQAFDLRHFLHVLVKDKWNPSLWYLYAYLGFLICLPFLRALVQNLENKYFYYLFLLSIIFNGILPLLHYYSNIFDYSKSFDVTWVLDTIVLYPSIGYFIHNRYDIAKHKRIILFMWGGNTLSMTICCYTTYYIGMKSGQAFTETNSQSCLANFVMINCATLFLTFKYIFEKVDMPKAARKAIASIGGCTYGIYLMHYWFEMKNPFLLRVRWNWPFWMGINQMIASFFDCFTIMVLGYIVTLLMKKVPLLKKII